MSTAFSMAPLLRQSIGFDRFNDLFESALRSNEAGSSYPPYNVEKHGDDQYRIVIAAAGFHEEDLELQVERGVLTVAGGKRERSTENVTYLHQGIALGAKLGQGGRRLHAAQVLPALFDAGKLRAQRRCPQNLQRPRRIALAQQLQVGR